MKKNLLLVIALFVSAFVWGQNMQVVKKSADKSDFIEKRSEISGPIKQVDGVKMSMDDLSNAVVSKAPQAGLAYSKPEGTYHGTLFYDSSTNELGLYQPTIIGKAYHDWVFVPEGGSNYSWNINGSPMDSDAQGNGIYNMPVGLWYLPTLVSGQNSYYWHSDFTAGNPAIGSTSEVSAMAMADIWFETNGSQASNRSGFTGYGYGTVYDDEDPTVASIQFYTAPQSPLSVEQIEVQLFTDGTSALPGSNFMLCEIYPLIRKTTDSGLLHDDVDWDNGPLATSERVYSGDLKTPPNNIFAIFKFVEEDPETGLVGPMDLVLEDAFAIVLTWSNGADFGNLWGVTEDLPFEFASTNGPIQISGARALTQSGRYWIYSLASTNQFVDLYMNVVGSMTHLEVDSRIESITIPNAGGTAEVVYTGEGGGTYNNVIVESSFQAVDLKIEEVPSWLTYTIKDELEQGEFLDAVSIVFTGEALSSGSTGRTAEVVVNAKGVKRTIKVVQGVTAIGSVKAADVKAVTVADGFRLSYPAAATSVAVYNVTGQRIAEYNLNATGTFTIPANDLANGVYVLKFNGINASVKVVK